MLDHLESAALYVNLKKCSFAIGQVKFLSFIVSRDGVSADPKKVATI